MDNSNSGGGRKKLKHRLAAFLAAISRKAQQHCRRQTSPSYSRVAATMANPPRNPLERQISFPAPRAAPLVHISIDCSGRRSVDVAALPTRDELKKKERRLTETGMSYETGEWEGRKCPPASPCSPPLVKPKKKEQAAWSFLPTAASRKLVTSSSSDDEDDARNLFSSRSFSSDSSDFYNCPRKNKGKTASRPPKRGPSQSCRYSFEERPMSVARLSSASAADGGFAVVKRSADPYEDFRKSMEEMIAECAAAGGEHDADRLLETYLVLNSPRHYPAILTAFSVVRDSFLPGLS